MLYTVFSSYLNNCLNQKQSPRSIPKKRCAEKYNLRIMRMIASFQMFSCVFFIKFSRTPTLLKIANNCFCFYYKYLRSIRNPFKYLR